MKGKPHRGGFQPGVSGNPAGRPKGTTLRRTIVKIMEEVCPDDAAGRTYRELFTLTLIRLAMKGNGAAIREVCGRYDGVIPQTIEITDKRDRPLINVHWETPPVSANGTNGTLPRSLPPAE